MKHRVISLAGPGGPSEQDVQLDVERLAGTRLLVQGGSGSGKSYLLRRLIEQFSLLKMQVIVVDPEGEFNTIREKFPFVLCGPGGETAARVDTAAIFAHKLLKLGASAICDLYELAPTDRQLWVGAFLNSMVNAPKNLWREVVIIIDEAHMFCPEAGSSPAKDAMIALNSRGRKRGFIPIWGTQRLAKIDKDAAAELQNVLIGLTFIDVDLKRAIDVLGIESDYAKAERRTLRTLKPGYFYAFGVAVSKTVQMVQIGPAITTHPKITGGRRRKSLAIKTPTQIKAFLKELNDLPKEAAEKRSTEEQLRSEIAALKERLRTGTSAPAAAPSAVEPKRVIALQKRVTTLQGRLSAAMRVVRQAGQLAASAKRVLKGDLDDAMAPPIYGPTAHTMTSRALKPDPAPAHRVTARTESTPGKLSKGEGKILAAIASFPRGVTRGLVTVSTGYKKTSRDTYISRLVQRGFATTNGNTITATAAGMAELGANFDQAPTGRALYDWWRSRLPKGELAILDALMTHRGKTSSREHISEATGYKKTSRDTYISRLVARELVSVDDSGHLAAESMLFE